MQTLLLDQVSWDLVVDAFGNIAVASNPYSLAQDAASAGRTFLGEVWYDTTLGIPYFDVVLGKPPLPIYRSMLITEILRVPEIVAARVFFSGLSKAPTTDAGGNFVQGRQLTGQIQVTDNANQVSALNF